MKPGIYKYVDSEPVLLAYQCWRVLAFHHESYGVSRCKKPDGHTGPHLCNRQGCDRTFEED